MPMIESEISKGSFSFLKGCEGPDYHLQEGVERQRLWQNLFSVTKS